MITDKTNVLNDLLTNIPNDKSGNIMKNSRRRHCFVQFFDQKSFLEYNLCYVSTESSKLTANMVKGKVRTSAVV